MFGVFPPYGGAGAVRAVKLIKYLARCGWDVDVVAPKGRAGWFRDESLAQELGGATVVRTGLATWAPATLTHLRAAGKDSRRTGVASRGITAAMRVARALRSRFAVPDERVVWAAAAAWRAQRMLAEHPYDVLWTSSFPYSAHLAGWWLRHRRPTPWVAELQDPWLGNPFRPLPPWRDRIDSCLESQVIQRADAVVVASPGMRRQLEARYACDKVHVITNGFDPDDFAAEPAPPSAGPVELVYAGTFVAAVEPPDAILDALALVVQRRPQSRDDLVLRIVGGADLESAACIRAWMAKHRAGKMIDHVGFVSHQRAVQHMRRADLLLLSVAERAPWLLTSKVFEYLASGRPILAAVPEGDCRKLLEDAGGAAICRPSDRDGMADVICAVAERRHASAVARPDAQLAHYSHAVLAGELAAVFERVAR